MELLRSISFFLSGTLKRVQWYLPPLLLDPFDIAERLFKVNYPPPQWLAWFLFGLGWFIAIILTYHELRKQNMALDKQDINRVVGELLSVGIYTDCLVNITRILYRDKDKLAAGLLDREASVQDKLVLAQLNLRNIVKLEQRQRVAVRGSFDEGYWVLTELGKDVILYLEENKQVLDTEGSPT